MIMFTNSDWKYLPKSVVLHGYWIGRYLYNIIYYNIELNGTKGLTTVSGWDIYFFFLFSARDPARPKVDARDQVFARSDRTPGGGGIIILHGVLIIVHVSNARATDLEYKLLELN